MLKVSDTFIVGIDISNEDEAVVSVSKNGGSRLEYVNTITGDDAKALYELLTNKNKKGGN